MPRSRERKARRDAARQQDQGRRRVEAGEVLGDEDLRYLPITAPVEHPSLAFIFERMTGVAPEDTDRKLALAVLALAQSYRPLDPARVWIQYVLNRFLFPDDTVTERQAFELLIKHFEDRGDPAPLKQAAKALGVKVETLRKKMQRVPKRDKQK
jgi:hypothetical protein